MSNFVNAFNQASNLGRTENGALSHKTTSLTNPLVAALYTASQYRDKANTNREETVNQFQLALQDDSLREYCIRFALMVRDIECGMGERELGRVLFQRLFEEVALTERQVHTIIDRLVDQKYGRWDDVIFLAEKCKDSFVRKILVGRIVTQLVTDVNAKQDQPVSLLGKWMPSINAGKMSRRSAIKWSKVLKLSHSQYRKMLVDLRKRIDIVEARISANQYDQIDYGHVPSLAFIRHMKTFFKHDGIRFNEFLESVNRGESSIHTSTSSVPELVAQYRQNKYNTGVVDTVNTMWNDWNLQSYERNVLPICDVSGSMMTKVGKLECIDVSLGLTIYAAAANKGIFHNKVIAFSHQSEIISLDDEMTLVERVQTLCQHEGYNTNVENVLSNVLAIAEKGNCQRDEIPTLVFFSDMEFDAAMIRSTNSIWNARTLNRDQITALFDLWRERYNAAGFDFPKVVFWNINNRSGTVPMIDNDTGLILVSGYNENLVRMVFDDSMDPWEALKVILDDPRYDVGE